MLICSNDRIGQHGEWIFPYIFSTKIIKFFIEFARGLYQSSNEGTVLINERLMEIINFWPNLIHIREAVK